MLWVISCFVFVVSLAIGADAAVRTIVGSSVDASTPPPPLGCNSGSVFNMVASGPINTFTTGLGSGNNPFVTGPLEDSYRGRGFNVASTSTSGITLAQFALTGFAFTGETAVSVAGSPDAAGAYNLLYDNTLQRVIYWSQQVVAPCGGSACLHVKAYTGNSGGSPSLILDNALTLINVGSANSQGGVADASNYYITMPDAAGTPTRLYKLNKSLGSVGSVNITNPSQDMVDDGSFLYTIDGISNVIRRIEKTTLIVTSFTFGTVTNFTGGIDYHLNSDTLYASGLVGGVQQVVQILKSTMTIIGSVNINPETVVLRGLRIDQNADKLYAMTANGASWAVRRMNLAPFANAQTITNTDGGNTGWWMAPDFIHKALWFTDVDSPGHLHKVSLCS